MSSMVLDSGLAKPSGSLVLPIAGYVSWHRSTLNTFQDAARSVVAVADADPVGGWVDLSGFANHASQATSTKRLTLKTGVQGGRSGLLGDGVDDGLVIAANPLQTATDFTIVTVIKTGTIGDYLNFCGNRNNAASAVTGVTVGTKSTVGEGLNANSIVFANGTNLSQNSVRGTPTNSIANNTAYVVTCIWTNGAGSPLQIRINGTNQTITDWNVSGQTPTLTNTWRGTDDGWGICNPSVAYSQQPFPGHVFDQVLYPSAMSAANALILERALGSYYSITVA